MEQCVEMIEGLVWPLTPELHCQLSTVPGAGMVALLALLCATAVLVILFAPREGEGNG